MRERPGRSFGWHEKLAPVLHPRWLSLGHLLQEEGLRASWARPSLRTSAAKEELRRERTKQAGQVTWGDVRLPQEAETSHFLAVGTTGSGKSLTLGKLMRQALSSARPGSDIRALIYDPKQELMSFLAGLELEVPVLTLNAFDRRGC
jgi:hypothetical protein